MSLILVIFLALRREKYNKQQPNKSLGYKLYANGIILDISLKRTAKNERNEEQYMLRFSFQSVRYNERDSIPDSDKMTPSEFEQAFKRD